jgi:hypothetical protein
MWLVSVCRTKSGRGHEMASSKFMGRLMFFIRNERIIDTPVLMQWIGSPASMNESSRGQSRHCPAHPAGPIGPACLADAIEAKEVRRIEASRSSPVQ